MLAWIDRQLNGVTMYRLVLYVLLGILGAAFALSLFGVLAFHPLALLFSTLFLTTMCVIVNDGVARLFHSPTNVESAYITALILALIISPPTSPQDGTYFSLAIWASILAIATKFIFAIRRKHLFNPAAIAVAATGLFANLSASWWVGTVTLLPFVLVGGLLVVRKIRRADLVLSFLMVALASIVLSAFGRGVAPLTMLWKTFADTPILFFAFIMLTEPLTTPPTRAWRIAYGALVGFLYAPWIHIGSLYTTPELALVLGNAFSYLVSPKEKLLLRLKQRLQVADHVADFLFQPERRFAFAPGQYMEWTLDHDRPDQRGNRRYFTLANSPTESDLRLGVKFYPEGSTFKHALWTMDGDDAIVAAQLAGDFVLPKQRKQKLVFIAGGIGITPFRSMVKYLIDTRERRDIVLFYSNRSAADVAYADVFDAARDAFGMKTIYTLTDEKTVPPDWRGHVGTIDAQLIAKEVPDYAERIFYISGPHGMVTAFEQTLRTLGVPRAHIKTDFFPGFA